jgi:hypothetical protein
MSGQGGQHTASGQGGQHTASALFVKLQTAGIKLNAATAATSTVKETQIKNLGVCRT